MSFERSKFFYLNGLWNSAMVRAAVRKGVITKEQYEEITGEEYK